MRKHTRKTPCEICGGGNNDKKGTGVRCWGFTSDDGKAVHCTRQDYAGNLRPYRDDTYVHFLIGPCLCGITHGSNSGAATSGADTSDLKSDVVAEHDYIDEHGALLRQVIRKKGKQFRQRQPNGEGWDWNVKGVRNVPYRLPQLIAAVAAGDTVYITEGEKDADALSEQGFTATCNIGGAGKWKPELCEYFKSAHVVIWADWDEPGRKHAWDVFDQLSGIAASVQVVRSKSGKDAFDHLEAGHMLHEVIPVV